MYTLKFGDQCATFPTLAAVLGFMNQRSFAESTFAIESITLQVEDRPLPIVRNRYGAYGILQEGSAKEIFDRMMHEIEQHYVRPEGLVLAPYQMSAEDWSAVVAVGKAAFNVLPCFTEAQLAESFGSTQSGGFTFTHRLSNYCEMRFVERFGWEHNGPPYDRSGQTNCRHEVQVAYALAAGKPVPEFVIDYYKRAVAAGRDFGMRYWFRAVLEIPTLRGRIPTEKLTVLCSVLGHAKIELTPENTESFVGLMGVLDAQAPTNVEMDDFLFTHGVLAPLPSERPQRDPVDLSAACSVLALGIRTRIAQGRLAAKIKRLDEDRASGNISKREHARASQDARSDVAYESLTWPNAVATAVEEKDLPFLLDALDTPDERNQHSKRAIQEATGVKLLGLKAATRRAAIFALCGYDEDQRKQYETDEASRKAHRILESEKKEAATRAAESRWRVDGGAIINGKEYVDQAVAEGFSEIEARKRGRATEYWLMNRAAGRLKNVRAKDGTLDYARLVHSLPVAQVSR